MIPYDKLTPHWCLIYILDELVGQILSLSFSNIFFLIFFWLCKVEVDFSPTKLLNLE